MVNQAGIEVLIFIIWILFSIYGSTRQKKKKEMKNAAPQGPTVQPVPEEDPFKKILDELRGRHKEPTPQPVKTQVSKPILSEMKRPAYESIPSNYQGTQGSMPDSASLSGKYTSSIDNYSSIEGKYQTPHFLTPDQEGVSTTITAPVEKAKGKQKPIYGMLINGRRVSMRDAIVAQILLEKRI